MSRKSSQVFEGCIEALAHDGRGITRIEGKATFVDGALPGEVVKFGNLRRRKKLDEADLLDILEPSPQRVEPRCAHFGVCGGCSLQHLDHDAQVAYKQQGLLDNLKRIGRAEPGEILPPLVSDIWGYRRKARLGAKLVAKKGRVLVGFRERSSPFLADMHRCEILHPAVGDQLEALSELIGSLSKPDRIPQIEVAIGDEEKALVFRHLDPLNESDLTNLRAYGERSGFQIMLQPKGPDTIHCIWPEEAPPLSYALAEFDVEIQFLASDFTQVNAGINRQMVARALELLAPEENDQVLELFCGLGNFSLPLARRVGQVTGVEGDAGLVARARENVVRNGCDNAEFFTANLFEPIDGMPWARRKYDRVLLDPARSGALEICQQMKRFVPERIVYVSCNPATLARDTEELVHNQGYVLKAAGIMDMFPHTTHVESIAVFERA